METKVGGSPAFWGLSSNRYCHNSAIPPLKHLWKVNSYYGCVTILRYSPHSILPHGHLISTHHHKGRRARTVNMIFWERPHSVTFISVYHHSYSSVLLFTLVDLLLVFSFGCMDWTWGPTILSMCSFTKLHSQSAYPFPDDRKWENYCTRASEQSCDWRTLLMILMHSNRIFLSNPGSCRRPPFKGCI
jgi:hypothetical protein